ncbi:MAG: hypothetical protein PVG03_01080 [Desulfarculaceae bacterium]
MSDQRVQYNEELVGANHPTKSDTLNRLALVECGDDGKGNFRYLVKQDEAPETGEDELVLYAKEVGSELVPFVRMPNNGEEKRLGAMIEWVRTYYVTLTRTATSDFQDFAFSIDDVGDISRAVVRLLGPVHYNPIAETGTTQVLDPHIRFKDTDEVYINIYDGGTGQFQFCFSVTKFAAGVLAAHYYTAIGTAAAGWNDTALSITDLGDAYTNNKAEIVPGTLTDYGYAAAATSKWKDLKWRFKDSDEVYARVHRFAAGDSRNMPFSIITFP